MKYIKRRSQPAHQSEPNRDVCRHCGWSRQYVVNSEARRCPVRQWNSERKDRS